MAIDDSDLEGENGRGAESDSDGGTTNADMEVFDPMSIRDRLPSRVTDAQERALIGAIRNPDASLTTIAEATPGVETHNLQHVLDSIACGTLADATGDAAAEAIAARGEARDARTYAELTDTQQTVIDAVARYPRLEDKAHGFTQREFYEALNDVLDDGLECHYTTPADILRQYEHLVDERRRTLTRRGEVELGGSVDLSVDRAAESVPTASEPARDILAAAGYGLPDDNLDDLEADHAESPLGEQARLEIAYERGQEDDAGPTDDDPADDYLGPLSCPACGTEARGYLACPSCGAAKVHDGAVPVVDGTDEGLMIDDVHHGAIYRAVVERTESFGVFVRLAAHSAGVTGLLHRRNGPDALDHDLHGFEPHDELHVTPVDIHDASAEQVHLAWPTAERLEDVEVQPLVDADPEDLEYGAEYDTAASEAAVAELIESVRTLEGQVTRALERFEDGTDRIDDRTETLTARVDGLAGRLEGIETALTDLEDDDTTTDVDTGGADDISIDEALDALRDAGVEVTLTINGDRDT